MNTPTSKAELEDISHRGLVQFNRMNVQSVGLWGIQAGASLDSILFTAFMYGWLIAQGVELSEVGKNLMVEKYRN